DRTLGRQLGVQRVPNYLDTGKLPRTTSMFHRPTIVGARTVPGKARAATPGRHRSRDPVDGGAPLRPSTGTASHPWQDQARTDLDDPRHDEVAHYATGRPGPCPRPRVHQPGNVLHHAARRSDQILDRVRRDMDAARNRGPGATVG